MVPELIRAMPTVVAVAIAAAVIAVGEIVIVATARNAASIAIVTRVVRRASVMALLRSAARNAIVSVRRKSAVRDPKVKPHANSGRAGIRPHSLRGPRPPLRARKRAWTTRRPSPRRQA